MIARHERAMWTQRTQLLEPAARMLDAHARDLEEMRRATGTQRVGHIVMSGRRDERVRFHLDENCIGLQSAGSRLLHQGCGQCARGLVLLH